MINFPGSFRGLHDSGRGLLFSVRVLMEMAEILVFPPEHDMLVATIIAVMNRISKGRLFIGSVFSDC